MLDEHTEKKKEKKKPAGEQRKHPRSRITIRPHILQEKGSEHEELLPARSEIPDEEVTGLPEEWILEAERPREISPGKPADSPHLPHPIIHSAVKSAMKSALLPKPDFQKPARRPKILPVLALDEEPLPAEAEDSPDYGKKESPREPGRHPKILPVVDRDAEPLPAEADDSPDYGEDQDFEEAGDLLRPSFFPDSPDTDEEPEDDETTPVVKNPPYCKDCGKKLPPIANFCPGCGTYLGISFQPRDPKRRF